MHPLLFLLLLCTFSHFHKRTQALAHPHVLKIAPEALASTSLATLLFRHSAIRSYQSRGSRSTGRQPRQRAQVDENTRSAQRAETAVRAIFQGVVLMAPELV